MDNPTALYITATPKAFRKRRVVKSLNEIAELSHTTKLGDVVDNPHYAPLKLRKNWTLKIFFATTDDLVDFQRRTVFKEHLKDMAKHCKNKGQGLETILL